MLFLEPFLVAGAIVLTLMAAVWAASLFLRNSSIVDIFWGPGFVAVGWTYFVQCQAGLPARKWLLAGLVSAWGLRLGAHILVRNWGKPEDFRYRKWREEAGRAWAWRSLITVFLLQGLLISIISAPLLAAQLSAPGPSLSLLDFLAVAVWLTGFFFEAAGDWQLARFKRDPANRGRILQTGVWRYSRHPNYFGDAVQWWAFWLIAAAAGGYWTVFSPILMTFLLRRVSGVTLLEKTLVESKPGYREYAAATNAFLPWFPRRK